MSSDWREELRQAAQQMGIQAGAPAVEAGAAEPARPAPPPPDDCPTCHANVNRRPVGPALGQNIPDECKFVYPYNFVPPPDLRNPAYAPKRKHHKDRSRLDGYSGTIRYTLRTLSPLFIPDPEHTAVRDYGGQAGAEPAPEESRNQHRFMRFFEIGGKLCIPGSSIRGMIRSLAEAVTGSSITIRGDDWTRTQTWRKVAGGLQHGPPRLKVGLYHADGTVEPLGMVKVDRQWVQDLLLCHVKQTEREDKLDQLNGRQVQFTAWRIHTGQPVVVELNGTPRPDPLPQFDKEPPRQGTLRWREGRREQHKPEVVANGRRYPAPREAAIMLGLARGSNAGIGVRFAMAQFTGPQVDSHDHYRNRVYWMKRTDNGQEWRADQHADWLRPWDGPSGNSLVPLTNVTGHIRVRRFWDVDKEQRANSNYVHILYQVGNAPRYRVSEEAWSTWDRMAALCDAQHPAPRPTGDDWRQGVVFFRVENNKVVEVSPAHIWRVPEDMTINDIAEKVASYREPRRLRSEGEGDLCPATRLFGHAFEVENARNLASRVFFNMAWSKEGREKTHPVTLDILGAPKPSYYPFYLTTRDATAAQAKTARYSDPQACCVRLRGRKFYLHHKAVFGCTVRQWQDLFGIPPAPEQQQEPAGQQEGAGQQGGGAQAADGQPESAQPNPPSRGQFKEKPANYPFTNQNCTVYPCECGVSFEGSIDFESLDEEELALLLWCLGAHLEASERQQKHALKLGMGKPLGLGSVWFDNIRLELDPQPKCGNGAGLYESLSSARSPECWDRSRIEAGVAKLLGVTSLAEREHIAVLQGILDTCLLDAAQPDRPAYRAKQYAKLDKNGSVTRFAEVFADEGYGYFSLEGQKHQPRRRDPANPALLGEEPLLTPQQLRSGRRQQDTRFESRRGGNGGGGGGGAVRHGPPRGQERRTPGQQHGGGERAARGARVREGGGGPNAPRGRRKRRPQR